MSKSSPIGFVLSGGATVGTSASALNGAYVASRAQSVETTDHLGEIWCGLRPAQVFPLKPVTGLLGFLGTRGHHVQADTLIQRGSSDAREVAVR